MKSKIFDFIDLHNGEEDKQKVLENVTSSISFRGSNLWILACAIVVASVGLNVNSTAVIIGAMLISPLMGPIVGAGFALGTYNFELLKKSIKNLLIATLVSLLVSTIYFFISPFKETQSELFARISPNIYDVLIAFFGGLVGVIAITRVEKGNPIPGVAIATALMPPLCTAGYGLAIGNLQYFLGAFYLYVINCFFICIATFFIIKYLKYKPIHPVYSKHEKQIRYGITILVLVMIIPSFYLAYNLFKEKQFTQNVEKFITNEITNNSFTIIYKRTQFNSNPKKIELALLERKLDSNEIAVLNNKLSNYYLENTILQFKQEATDLKSEILNEIGNQSRKISEKDIVINNLKNELNAYKFNNFNVLSEIAILFPYMSDISIGKHILNANTDSANLTNVLIYKTTMKNMKEDELKLKQWLQQKFGSEQVEVLRKD